MKGNWRDNLYIVTILFFILGFVNIIFAWLGFVCMILPFVFLAKDKKKTWCQRYCPRAGLFRKVFNGRSLTGKAAPSWLTKGRGKWIVLTYFMINLFILTMSTVMVFKGRREAMETVRFLIAFKLPWDMPQLLNIGGLPNWAIHLSYRMYSMMLTTTVIGLILAWLFLPRTWCTICPISTISDISLKKMNNKKQ